MRVIALDLDPQLGIAEAHAITASSVRTSPHRRAGSIASRQRTHDPALKAVHHAVTGEGHQLDVALLARLEAHRGAGCDVEPIAARPFAIELQRVVGLVEMVVRSDLDRSIAAIGDGDTARFAALVQRQLALLATTSPGSWRPHQVIGWCTVTSLVPSGNVASTWTSAIISGDAFHDLAALQQGRAVTHQLRHRAPVARALEDRGRNIGHRLRVVEFEAPCLAPSATTPP